MKRHALYDWQLLTSMSSLMSCALVLGFEAVQQVRLPCCISLWLHYTTSSLLYFDSDIYWSFEE